MWQRARNLYLDVVVLYFACRDARVPVYTKVFSACVVGYAFSPVDLIPDFIAIAGQFDDLVIVPLGFLAARRMIPAPILEECRGRAVLATRRFRKIGWFAAGVTFALCLSTTVTTIWIIRALVR